MEENAYCSWYSDNADNMKEEFIKEHKNEYDEFLDSIIVDETYDLDYWEGVFCNEEMEQEFYDFCQDAFHDSEDARQSDWDDYKSMKGIK